MESFRSKEIGGDMTSNAVPEYNAVYDTVKSATIGI